MLAILSPENLEDVAANILHSNMQDLSEFCALAQQVGFCKTPVSSQYLLSAPGWQCCHFLPPLQIISNAMRSREETDTWSKSCVTLINTISDAHVVGVTKPLGGSSGPGKAFRSDRLLCSVVCSMHCALRWLTAGA